MMQPEGNAGSVAGGTVLGETYELVRLIGQGGMGAVWEAKHLRLPGKRVAVKVLLASVGAQSEAFARFRREAEIASRLGHANIVEVLDFNIAPSGAPYLVLELLQGQNLASRLRHGPLPPGEALPIARQIGAALAAAHQAGIVHRDLKPENVFLCPPADEGATGPRVKVLDFGISKITGSSTVQTQEQRVMGTPQYMAPEQAKGQNSTIDARSDVFALGAIVYEMLSGVPAFSGENLAEVVFRVVYEAPAPLAPMVPGAPAGVIRAVERALEKEPSARWPDISSMIEALTGRPLATLDRGPIVASGSDTRRSDEAFAHTVASQSGDSDKRGGAATVARPGFGAGTGSGANAPGGFSPTMPAASGDLPGPKTPSPSEPVPPRGSGRAMAIAAGVLLGIAAVGVGGWWFGQNRKNTQPRVANVAIAPAPTDAAPPPADAAPALAATPPDAAPAPPTPPVRKPTPRVDKPDSEPAAEPAPEDEGSARTFLDQAAAALHSGDPKEAIRLARRSLNERRTVRAYSLIARAYCRLGDLGNGRAQLAHLPLREKKRVIRLCKQEGVDLTP